MLIYVVALIEDLLTCYKLFWSISISRTINTFYLLIGVNYLYNVYIFWSKFSLAKYGYDWSSFTTWFSLRYTSAGSCQLGLNSGWRSCMMYEPPERTRCLPLNTKQGTFLFLVEFFLLVFNQSNMCVSAKSWSIQFTFRHSLYHGNV